MGKEQQQVISAVPTKTNATRTESPHFRPRLVPISRGT